MCEYGTPKREESPARDTVPRSVFEQVVWERDMALAQLAEIGKGLGEKMDDIVEVINGKAENR